MQYEVIFTPEALEQLAALYHYIALAASPNTAKRYTDAIVAYCEGFHTSPLRGTKRNDIRPGLRITNFKGRTVIAFDVSETTVAILGVFYGGQDFEHALRPDDWDFSQ